MAGGQRRSVELLFAARPKRASCLANLYELTNLVAIGQDFQSPQLLTR